jgi:hypothetical protein
MHNSIIVLTLHVHLATLYLSESMMASVLN